MTQGLEEKLLRLLDMSSLVPTGNCYMKYLHENGCHWNEKCCSNTSINGDLKVSVGL